LENLHEAAEFDHGGDQALERLPDALLEISALEESRDVAIGLIGTLLEPRSALAERAERGGVIARGGAAGRSDQRLEGAVYDQVRVAADGGREVRVVRERKSEVTDIGRLVDRLGHGAH